MIRVLIVEDDTLIASAHASYLERIGGFEVVAQASTAQQAMRAAAGAAATASPIDLTLLDLGLPDASGIDLASALSGIRPEPDIIAITSQRDLAMVRAAVSRGVLLYLLKPFTFAAFRDKMERYQRYRAAVSADAEAVSQRDIDTAIAELRSNDPRPSARKGASPATSDSIARLIRDSADGLTASEVAAALGISRVTGWRHLEALADDGTVARATEYGTTGRPQVRYTWRR
ncbi:response regulator [Williamsia sterculiae]|uniref:Transcriptional regulatory protein n=1 Tax=Williamsia sterculiae TaxID=1344003 RepID=A0A1N7G9V5_9NOCA|nr:response regulator [Williamsia sterculiae]SIS09369.1 Response regulator of citrate/malate metabolism [Williamsia sterculiae]